mgnify:CR=1 FL=1
MTRAATVGMRTLTALLILACAQPERLAAPDTSSVVLPQLIIPPDTLLLREHLSSRGPERTGNWWARFDSEGCYTEAHNSWMWVIDPLLQQSSAWTLHWNGSPRLDPWFCLTKPQLAMLKRAAGRVDEWGGAPHDPGPVDRWTVVVEGRAVSIVLPNRGNPGGFHPLFAALQRIAEQGVWGQSPEVGAKLDGRASAFLP